MEMSPIARQEFADRVKAYDSEQKRIVASLLPMEIIEEELNKRYKTVEEILESIKIALDPYMSGNVKTYDQAMNVVDNVVSALHEGSRRLKEKVHERDGED